MGPRLAKRIQQFARLGFPNVWNKRTSGTGDPLPVVRDGNGFEFSAGLLDSARFLSLFRVPKANGAIQGGRYQRFAVGRISYTANLALVPTNGREFSPCVKIPKSNARGLVGACEMLSVWRRSQMRDPGRTFDRVARLLGINIPNSDPV